MRLFGKLVNPSSSSPGTPEVLESQKAALLKLLSDEDPLVYAKVREKILSYGQSAGQWVRRESLSNEPLVRRRAQEIIEHLGRQAADNKFLAFCLNQGEEFDLEHASLLLAQTHYPEINIDAYHALFDNFASDLRMRINLAAGPDAILATINHYLFTELGFTANEQNYYDLENTYLSRVIDRRTGNPISLCLVYLFVGRRLKLPLAGIGMPNHFVLRYQSSTREIYIDAFHSGKLLMKADCIKYLVQTSGFQEAYLAPVSARRTLLRMCSNLHQIYLQMQKPDEVSRLQRYIVALAK